MNSSSNRIVTGIIDENVILPCTVTHKEDFSYNTVKVMWRMKDLRVHYFISGVFKEDLQCKTFSGRTQLFPEEFPKGNMSLLLKNIQSSDAGTYDCFVLLQEYPFHFVTNVELVVQDKTYGCANETSLSLGVAIICLILVLCVLLRRRKRSRGRTGISLGNEKQEMKKTL
ncbi:CD276 antigen homolog isoform X2 [Pseudophryne corroboree]|uniref:CD276 antigen homolog isoform X2 n=1 Tax=Pseudophryne corroboree TaxID=495146 RepID=UPI0030813193